MQTDMEAVNKPIIHLLLKMLYHVNDTLQRTSAGVMDMSFMQAPHRIVQDFASCTLSKIRKIVVNYIWVAACVLHHGLRDLSIIISTKKCAQIRGKDIELIRRIMQGHVRDVDPDADEQAARASVPTSLVDTEFRVDAAMDFFGSIADTDEVLEYLELSLTKATKELMSDKLSNEKFWVQNRSHFLSL